MKKVVVLIYAAVLLAFSFLFAACFSPYQGDEAFLTINLGGNPRAMAWTETGVMPEVLGELEYRITLSGAGNRTFTAKGGNTIRVSVSPGIWDVKIEAYYDEILFAAGTGGVDVKAGQDNPVTIKMNETDVKFFVVASSEDWDNAVSLIGDLPGKTCVITVIENIDLKVTSTTSSATFPSGPDGINVIIRGNHTVKLSVETTGSLLKINIGQTVTMRDLKLKGHRSKQTVRNVDTGFGRYGARNWGTYSVPETRPCARCGH
jgi:hypothetical protein